MATLPKIVYNFNENSTTTIRDYTENGNNATATGITLAASTRVGRDAVFTDSTNSIDLGNITYLNGVTDAAIHLSIDFGTNGSTRKVLVKSGVIDIEVIGGGTLLRFSLTDATATTITLDATYTGAFEDYDLVITSNAVVLYQDGSSVDTGTLTGGFATSASNMYIGYDGSVNSAVFNLNEFKLYDTSISTDNIAAFIAEQNGIYTDSGMDGEFNVGDVIGTNLLNDPAEIRYGVISWVGTNSEFRFLPLTDNIGAGQVFRRVAHLWDTDRQWGLVISDVPEICFYDGMSKSSEAFASNKKTISITKDGISGAIKQYAEFYTTTGGVTAISSTAKSLVISTTRINSNADIFTLSSNQLTIDKEGDYKFSFDCYLNNSSAIRTEYSFYIERKVSGGSFTEEVATRSATYQRGDDSGMSSSINCILTVASGDIFRFQVIRTDGSGTTGYQDDNGTRLTIEEK